jgi:hypothetical protein
MIPLTGFTTPHYLCLSQVMDFVVCSVFNGSRWEVDVWGERWMFEVRGGCLRWEVDVWGERWMFEVRGGYSWNCWPSLFKLSFHSVYNIISEVYAVHQRFFLNIQTAEHCCFYILLHERRLRHTPIINQKHKRSGTALPVFRLNFPRRSAREIFRLSTGIFRKYPSQTWYICLITPNII